MINQQSLAVPALVLRRTYNVPRERVFAAWTDPEIAVRFFSPGEMKATDIRMDVKAGGPFTITMVSPQTERVTARGIYREVKAPERLVMTWRWEEDDPAEEYDSLLTLEFNEQDGGTELVLTHEKLVSLESRARHEEGWTSIVDQLATVLES
ncbi:MAG: SRPBCC domain-containing protein [Candidatus Baltobacteraceae bacterium]